MLQRTNAKEVSIQRWPSPWRHSQTGGRGGVDGWARAVKWVLGKKAILSLPRHGGGDLVSLGHLKAFLGNIEA